MKSAFLTVLIAAVAIVVPTAPASAQDGVVLKPQYKAGYTYKFRQAQDMDMIMSIPGQGEIEQQIETEFLMTATATAREDAPGTRVTTTIDAIKMGMVNPAMGMNMTYDSSNPADDSNPLAAQFKPMIGQALVLVYDADDKVESVEGFDEFMAAAGGGAQMFTEEQFAQMADPTAMMGFDETPKAVGAKWKASPEVKMADFGTIKMPMDLHYSGDEELDGKSCARIDAVGTAEMQMDLPDDGTGQAGGVTTEDSSITGYYLIDPELRTVRKSVVNMDLTMTVNAGGQAMSIPMKQVVHFELLSADPSE